MYYVGIDVGGSAIKAGLVDQSGMVRDTRRVATSVDDLDQFVSTLVSLVAELQNNTGIDGVGVGIPGLRSSRTRVIEIAPNIPCLHDVNLEDVLSKRVGLPVITENDAKAAAYA